MAIDPKLLVVKPVSELETVVNPTTGQVLYYDGSNNLKKTSVESFFQMLNTFAIPLSTTDPSPTVVGWYKPTNAGTYANAGGLVAQESYDTLFYYNGTIWTRTQTKMPESIGFSEEVFNETADKYNTFGLLSRDLSSVSMPNEIALGAGSSIFTVLFTEDNKISKLRVKVANDGIGNFSYKRAGSILPLISSVPLFTGWNDILVNFDSLAGDYIGYNTATSTSKLYFGDNTGGNYYVANGAVYNGNIALEVYQTDIEANRFEDLVKMNISDSQSSKLATNVFNSNNLISNPKLRDLDYGVVSAFNSSDWKDLLGNNTLSVKPNSISGNFKYNAYAWSFAFTVNMPAMYSSSKTIATLNLGSYNVEIYAGGSGIGVTSDLVPNGITYNYGNKKLKIEIIADAYFLNVLVNGIRIGFMNIGNKSTQFNFVLNSSDSKTFEDVVFWDRDISQERALQWAIDGDPFNLKGIQDKLFPSTGNAISNHFLEGNPYFDVPAEQTIVEFKGKYFMYFTAAKSTPSAFIESGVAVAVSSRVDGGYMMHTNDVVIGGNRNMAGVTRAMASWAGVIGDFVYVFAAMDYTASNAGGKIFKSSDGLNFTQVGNILSSTSIPYFANVGIYPVKQSNNYYYGVVEGKPGSTWALHLIRSLNIESGWEVVQTLPTLAVNNNGMYGGGDLMKSSTGDRWMIIYHSAYELNGNAPTALFYAESTELEPKNWVKKGKILDINDELNYYSAFNCDQVATPQIIETNGKTYISEVLAQNAPDLYCQIRVLEFDGNKEELFGVVPLEYGFKSPYINPNASTFTKVIASGTSITNGVGSDGSTGITEGNTWRALVKKSLDNNLGRTITVVNGGVNGQNTTGMKTNLPALLTGNTGQIVILEGAINDAQTAGVGLPTATSSTNLSDMIDLVVASGNIPILTTPMPIDMSVSGIASAYTLQKRADLDTAIRNLASSKGVDLVDLDVLANNNLGLLVDGLHPNPNGYLFIANAISSKLI